MDLYPPFEANASGMLDVGDGHSLYWEESGNPDGVPVLFVHGGPGAGCAAPYRRFFDPRFWRVILFDQRGCGRSRPHASVQANTTWHLVADMEKLRRLLKVEAWALFGGSWGSTLALAYGQSHPDRVLAFVLRGVFLCRPAEIEWFMTGMGTFFPEARHRFAQHVAEDDGPELAAWYRRLTDPDPLVHGPAARIWYGYEEACARLIPRSDGTEADLASCLSMARLECHYMMHGGFFEPDQLLRHMDRIRHLPAAIVQGRYDVVCPPTSAWDLAAAWPTARLTMVPDAGHSAMEPGIRLALVAAVENFKKTLGQENLHKILDTAR
ncbi:prolyl aminopeptidase [Magnetospirillum aberrantis]|uniref:Proline iminopeptidase n=1 Tax=Magnetospirillum aberrantis SpK TaxID=908842 RepID=A0A7C9QRD5_9PROT|nr:prolyl aminopeptidase [Magnetospirillum aberrantis]NFV78740.1 prolyl aminopeptidase [Magnetospirillum aberrantis SpK]